MALNTYSKYKMEKWFNSKENPKLYSLLPACLPAASLVASSHPAEMHLFFTLQPLQAHTRTIRTRITDCMHADVRVRLHVVDRSLI